MKHLLLLVFLSSLSGCAVVGHETKIKDEQANLNVTCIELANWRTQQIGFSPVLIDSHPMNSWEIPVGFDSRDVPFRKQPGCHFFGHIWSLPDPHSLSTILCHESCNKYTRANGFALVKVGAPGEPEWMKANTKDVPRTKDGQPYTRIPLLISHD